MLSANYRAALLAATSLITAAMPGTAFAADAASAGANDADAPRSDQSTTTADSAGQANDRGSLTSADIIVIGSRAASVAPVASLTTTQPQSAVGRNYIDRVSNPLSDFTTIAAITPGVSLNGTANGIGLQETKLTIRGFQDGEYNVTYDSIPFSDTNNPTHHSTSFFPSNTVETVIVDRGPGNAGQLGQATYGGNINIYSRAVSDDMGGEISLAGGRWSTLLARFALQSGRVEALGGARFVVTGSFTDTDGALTNSGVTNRNIFGKGVIPIGTHNTLTLLATYNQITYFQSDKGSGFCGSANGTTPLTALTGENCNPASTIGRYGRNFGLTGTLPTTADVFAQDYFAYNRTDKNTDFEIARLQTDFGGGLSMDNRVYHYQYTNRTLSGQDASGTFGTANTVIPTPGGTATAGIPGYHKLNQYHTFGYIGTLDYEFGFGRLRVGGWYEWSHSYRSTYDVNLPTDAPNYREAVNATHPSSIANIAYDQLSSWNQYQLFSELELRPIEGVTITPGVKYVHFTRGINAVVNQTSRLPLSTEATWTRTLPFLTINVQPTSNLSFYGQYAQGFYVPDLSSFYSASTNLAASLATLQPQTSTNYQVGAVYHGNRFSIDADAYIIRVNNQIGTCTTAGCDTSLLVNIGNVEYRGVEGQVSVLAAPGLTLFVNGSLNEAQNSLTGRQIAKAPYGTAAAGILYSTPGGFNFSFTQKYTGPSYATEWNGNPDLRLYRISPYSVGDLAINQDIGNFTIGVNINNIFNDRSITTIKTSSKGAPTAVASNGTSYQSAYGQFDQLLFLPPTQFLVTARVRF